MNGTALPGAAPRLLTGAALLLWGWENGFLPYAACMTVIAEAARWVPWRWRFSAAEFHLVADASSLVLLAVVIYVFSTRGSHGIFLILALLPFMLFPLVLIQLYSEQGSTPLTALFISLRRLERAGTAPRPGTSVDLTLPYLLLCLIAASAGNRGPEFFFAAVTLLLGAALWPLRPRRFAAALWLVLFASAGMLGFAAQAGMVRLQGALEASVLEIMDRFMWRYRDPHHAATAIGSIGRLKLSDRIVLRVRTERPLRGPLLLREAAYDTYNYGIWTARDRRFTAIDPDVSGTSWPLQAGAGSQRAEISAYMLETTGVIPLPVGTRQVADVAATELVRNPYGTVSMEIRRGWIRYAALYENDAIAGDPPPTDSDLHVDRAYRAELEQLAGQLGLPDLSPAARVAAVERFFAANFTYTLSLRQRYPRGRYLAGFLFEERSGHCEMFATATAMLLRTAGIPARYAVGYAVDEFSELEDQYVARARHAHSWVMAFVDGQWRVVDTTPAVWLSEEAEQASGFEPFYDFWAWLNFRLASWRTQDDLADDEPERHQLLWLILPLAALLAWRLRGQPRVTRTLAQSNREGTAAGADSSLFRLVREFERRGYTRGPGETLVNWFRRVAAQHGPVVPVQALTLHYRWRFDPRGISPAEQQLLDAEVQQAIRELGPA